MSELSYVFSQLGEVESETGLNRNFDVVGGNSVNSDLLYGNEDGDYSDIRRPHMAYSTQYQNMDSTAGVGQRRPIFSVSSIDSFDERSVSSLHSRAVMSVASHGIPRSSIRRLLNPTNSIKSDTSTFSTRRRDDTPPTHCFSLNGLLYGDDPERTFTIQVTADMTIATVRKVLTAELWGRSENLRPMDLRIYRADELLKPNDPRLLTLASFPAEQQPNIETFFAVTKLSDPLDSVSDHFNIPDQSISSFNKHVHFLLCVTARATVSSLHAGGQASMDLSLGRTGSLPSADLSRTLADSSNYISGLGSISSSRSQDRLLYSDMQRKVYGSTVQSVRSHQGQRLRDAIFGKNGSNKKRGKIILIGLATFTFTALILGLTLGLVLRRQQPPEPVKLGFQTMQLDPSQRIALPKSVLQRGIALHGDMLFAFNNGTVTRFNAKTGAREFDLEGVSTLLISLKIDSTGQKIYSAGRSRITSHDTSTGKSLSEYSLMENNTTVDEVLYQIDLSADDQFLYIASSSRTRRVSTSPLGENPVFYTEAGINAVTDVNILGNSLFAAADDDLVRLYDANTGNAIRTYAGLDQNAQAIVVSSDRSVVYGLASFVIQWNVQTGERLKTFTITNTTNQGLDKLLPSNDNNFLYVGTSGEPSAPDPFAVAEYDVRTGRVSRYFVGHTAKVGEMVMSKDGTRLFTYGSDSNILIWDLTTKGTVITQSKGIAMDFELPSPPKDDAKVAPQPAPVPASSASSAIPRTQTLSSRTTVAAKSRASPTGTLPPVDSGTGSRPKTAPKAKTIPKVTPKAQSRKPIQTSRPPKRSTRSTLTTTIPTRTARVITAATLPPGGSGGSGGSASGSKPKAVPRVASKTPSAEVDTYEDGSASSSKEATPIPRKPAIDPLEVKTVTVTRYITVLMNATQSTAKATPAAALPSVSNL
ncbi:quinon protein alcohol dehydrogenase-like superfamily [Phlyctochytrium arcticum]|nr:quinon protein alcohol dehydrogenase-like superfamily [Phlyctochytrium arcticum]